MKDAKMRVMQITHDLAIGGLQRVVANICRAIDRDAFDVQVLCLRELGPFAADIERLGIKVALIPQTGRTDYFSFLKVGRVLRAERIDVIHTHNTQPFVDGRWEPCCPASGPSSTPTTPASSPKAPIHGSRAGHVAVCLPGGRSLGPYVRQPGEVREDRDGED